MTAYWPTLVLALIGFAVWTRRLGVLVRRAGHEDAPADTAGVSVIVPARNEEENLPPLLGSLTTLAPAPREVIIVDDHSTDATGDLARAAGVRVITPEALPAGWVGKPWACKAGASVAAGDLLLFSDADTVHARGSLGRAVARLRASGADMLSIVPTHVAVRLWEKLQGAFQLLLLIATRAGSGGDRGGRDFAIGQYLLFRRAAYDAIRGHDDVRAMIAEDLGLMRLIRGRGGRYELLLAPGLLRVRMYPEGLGAFLRGWRRNFRAGIGESGVVGVLEVTAVFAWLAGLPLALATATIAALAGAAWLPVAVLGGAWALTIAEVARRQRLVGELPWWGAIFAPVALLAFAGCTVTALVDHARNKPVLWRGRRVEVPRWRRAA